MQLTDDGMKLNLYVSILDRIEYKLSGFLDCGLLVPIFSGMRDWRY